MLRIKIALNSYIMLKYNAHSFSININIISASSMLRFNVSYDRLKQSTVATFTVVSDNIECVY